MGTIKRAGLLFIFLTLIYKVNAEPTFNIIDFDINSYPAVKAHYFATDTNANPLTNLNINDFILRDNSSIIPLQSVTCPKANLIDRLSLIIAFDLATSESADLSFFNSGKELVKDLIALIDSNKTECAITSFDFSGYLDKDFTNNKTELQNPTNNWVHKSGSSFDEGLLSNPAGALSIAKYGKYDRTILLITDNSGTINTDSIIKIAKNENCRIFCISYGKQIQNELMKISSQTNGKWLENVSRFKMNDLARMIISLMTGYSPCELSWQGPINCDSEHNIEIEIPRFSSKSTISYLLPDSIKPYIEDLPPYLGFGSLLPPAHLDQIVTIMARNKDIFIDSIGVTDSHFSIIQGNVKSFNLLRDNSHIIAVRFTPSDSAIAFSKLKIYSDACFGKDILLTGGFPNTPPNKKTLTMVYPNECNTVLVVGDTVDVQWDGLLPRDVIQLEYTINNGRKWDTLVKDINGLNYRWVVPDRESDSCFIRAVQIWPNNVGRTMNLVHNNGVNSAFFNTSNDFIVTACKDKTARVWNANNGKEILSLVGHTMPLTWAVFSPDDKLIVTASEDSTARIWDKSTGKLLHIMNGHTQSVRSVKVSPDNKYIITAGADGKAILWDTQTGGQVKTIESSSQPLWYATFSPDGKYILTAGINRYVNLYDMSTGNLSKSFDTKLGYIDHATFSPNGKKLVTSSQLGGAVVWDFETQMKICSVAHYDSVGNSTPIFYSDFDFTGDTILTSGFDQKVIMWNASTGDSIVSFLEHTNAVKTAVFNFDGSRVLTASWDSTAKIWNRNKRDLQMDTSDCPFRIARAKATSFNLDFGDVVLGEFLDSTVTGFLNNSAGFPINIRKIELIGSAKDDFTILDGASPLLLGSGEHRNFRFKFKPSAIGNREAIIRIIIPDDTLDYKLNGNGIAVDLKPISNYIDFGQVELGDYKDSTISVIVKNQSSRKITLSNISITQHDTIHFAILSKNISPVLNPGQSLDLTLRFTPEKLGRIGGSLLIIHDGIPSPTRISLFGEGIPIRIDTVLISLPTIEGKPGDLIDMPVFIKNISLNGIRKSITGFLTNIRFNSTLLEPQQPLNIFQSDTIIGFERILFASLPIDLNNSGILTSIKFRVGLGNDTISPLILENTSSIGKGKIVIFQESGKFLLTGYCKDGGIRLLDAEGKIKLYQNKPNPFNDITSIDFQLSEKGSTKLIICDMLGTVVRTLLDEELKPGEYSIQFQPSDLSSGIYYYILQTPTKKIIKRMDISK